MIKYIRNFWFDVLFFISPLFIVWIFTIIIHIFFKELLDIQTDPLWLFIFIVIFDVAHVWATLYMVYFNKKALEKHKKLYILTPIIVFIITFFIINYDRSWFLLFYIIWFLAVYHFIKQQIWFILIYAQKEENTNKIDKIMDKTIWWSITWIPILYWFCNLETRNYIWFMPWEFFKIDIEFFPIIWIIFVWIIFVYVIYETIRIFIWKKVNYIKYLYIFVTFFIWFNWIVWNNSLIIFAFWNVFLHWLNYLWLSYHSTLNKMASWEYKANKIIEKFIKKWFVWFFIILFVIAIVEEYLWDQFFRFEVSELWWNTFYDLAQNTNIYIFSIIISILTIPQITHYFLDWYIWKKDFNPKI